MKAGLRTRTIRGQAADTQKSGALLLAPSYSVSMSSWLRGLDLNQRPLGYEPNVVPDSTTPRKQFSRFG